MGTTSSFIFYAYMCAMYYYKRNTYTICLVWRVEQLRAWNSLISVICTVLAVHLYK